LHRASAARAGVRPSLKEPRLYVETNINGTLNLLELARAHGVKQFIFGSSSSVYGMNAKVPFSEDDPILILFRLRSEEGCRRLLCHSYAHLYDTRISVPALLHSLWWRRSARSGDS